jgi:hypothetical protein
MQRCQLRHPQEERPHCSCSSSHVSNKGSGQVHQPATNRSCAAESAWLARARLSPDRAGFRRSKPTRRRRIQTALRQSASSLRVREAGEGPWLTRGAGLTANGERILNHARIGASQRAVRPRAISRRVFQSKPSETREPRVREAATRPSTTGHRLRCRTHESAAA